MPNPAKLSFALPTFDAFKNYDRATITVSISGTVPGSSSVTYTGTADLARDNAITSVGFTTSADSDYHDLNQTYAFLPETFIQHSNGSTAVLPGIAAYSIIFTNEFSGNNVNIVARIGNPYGITLTPVAETLTFTLYTFVAPFAT